MLSAIDLANTEFCCEIHYYVTYTIMMPQEVDANVARRVWKSTLFIAFSLLLLYILQVGEKLELKL